MKRLKFFTLAMALVAATATLASGMFERNPIPFTASVIKGFNDPLGFKNTPVTVVIMVKDTALLVVYSETHDLNTNELAEVKTNIGTGSNQSPAYNTANFGGALTVCYTITVHDPEGDVVLMGESPFGLTSQSISAETAQNTNAIGKVEWGSEKVGPMELYVPPADVTFCIPVVRNQLVASIERPVFRQLALTDYVKAGTQPSAVDATPVDYLRIGTGNPCPLTFGFGDISEIENFYTLYPGPMDKYYNAFAVKVPSQRGPIGHSSAAIYAEHTFDAQAVGLFANGLSRGSYNQGRTGAFGLCNNTTGNGAGIWGFVQYDAAAGSGNYALLGSANGRVGSYAAYLDGDAFISGNLMGPSDRNLKTAITTSSYGLSTILKLRPTSFQYKKNTTHSFPEGEHYGFIAQEMEEIIPELVHDVTLPASMDPDQMSTGGTVQYKAINYLEMIPMLTKAIQDLNEKVESQAAEIKRLGNELKACKPK